jgi:hypothetical protein
MDIVLFKNLTKHDMETTIHECRFFFWYFELLIKSKSLHKVCNPPIEIRKSESPDFFIIDADNQTVGIEVCYGTISNHMKSGKILKGDEFASLTEDYYNSTEIPSKILRCKKGSRISGYGTNGFFAEEQTSDAIISKIQEKTSLLKTRYQKMNRNILLIHDCTPNSEFRRKHVELLNEKYKIWAEKEAGGIQFDEIIVFDDVRSNYYMKLRGVSL